MSLDIEFLSFKTKQNSFLFDLIENTEFKQVIDTVITDIANRSLNTEELKEFSDYLYSDNLYQKSDISNIHFVDQPNIFGNYIFNFENTQCSLLYEKSSLTLFIISLEFHMKNGQRYIIKYKLANTLSSHKFLMHFFIDLFLSEII